MKFDDYYAKDLKFIRRKWPLEGEELAPRKRLFESLRLREGVFFGKRTPLRIDLCHRRL